MATILVVDDERMICDLLRAVFSRHGHEVLTATSGAQGIALFREHRPRISLLDIHMPGMNGIEVLREIRAIDPQASVMMLTGVGTAELENQARELGVTDFLKKGLSLDVLIGALNRVVQQPGRPPTAHPPEPSAPDAGQPSVLVVDDEPMIGSLLAQFLSLRGYRVRTATDGQAALALVGQEAPRITILDMYMPGMNGVEVLRALRATGYAGGVIVLTASQDEKLLQEMLDLGSVDVMGKPVDLERLAVAIEVALVLSLGPDDGPPAGARRT
ncbi:response regulator [Nitrospira sp. Kam-Ns4a]